MRCHWKALEQWRSLRAQGFCPLHREMTSSLLVSSVGIFVWTVGSWVLPCVAAENNLRWQSYCSEGRARRPCQDNTLKAANDSDQTTHAFFSFSLSFFFSRPSEKNKHSEPCVFPALHFFVQTQMSEASSILENENVSHLSFSSKVNFRESF